MGTSMSESHSAGNPKQNSLAGGVIDISVALSTTPQLVAGLFDAYIPTGYGRKDILEVWIAAKQADASTDRSAILWGSATPITPVATGTPERIPLRGGKWYIASVSGTPTVILTALID